MSESNIRVFDVIDQTRLPEQSFTKDPQDGDPLEIDHEMFYICERNFNDNGELRSVGVIPLVVKNPSAVKNINTYIHCLSLAHRRVMFRKGNIDCDLNECDEMIIQ